VSGGNGAGAERAVRRALSEAQQGVLPVVSEMQAGWMRFHDPAAKLARRKRRTSRTFTLWLVLTLLSALFAVTGYVGVLGDTAGMHGALEGIVGLLIFGTFATRSGLKLRTLHRTELPRASQQPLPPTGSAAREPMRRLAECESSLSELLGSMPTDSATPQATADDAAAALRKLADRIRTIERARDHSPRTERAALDTDLSPLVAQLEDGVAAYAGLMAAAGRAVAASSPGTETESLAEATDRLAGFAAALRDLRSRP